MNEKFRAIFLPPPKEGEASTSLTFTDILFGFVISQLFVRLQNWLQLPWHVRWHLIVGAVLVLGSWIGFRRSAHRTVYEVKFFNLPLFRFLMDQVMVILYFRIAVLTPLNEPSRASSTDLANSTITLLLSIFVLYGLWDLFGMWMDRATMHDSEGEKRPKYPSVEKRKLAGAESPNFAGLLISAITLIFFGALWRFTPAAEDTALRPEWVLALAAILLVLYRMAKEIRTSWQSD